LKKPPICPFNILPPKGAGRDCGTMTSLALSEVNAFVPSKRQGIESRGAEVKKATFEKVSYVFNHTLKNMKRNHQLFFK
jgi:hypothetical protein